MRSDNMTQQIRATTRDNLDTVKFGGRVWSVIGRHYDTVTLEADGIRIYVRADLIEPVGVEETTGPKE